MDYLNSILSQQNQVQLVEEAIPTLCNRLQHATLSSDRRSAVLGLKSFSRQYRESVVEYGLRALITTLKKDSSNPVIIKAILETLLILFIRGEGDDDLTRGWISQQSRLQNGKYPSPILMNDGSIDHFSLWIADELTQDEECISLLLEILLENDNFHIRLYTLQLLEALVSTRGEKTKDCLLNIPTAVSTLVSLLNDSHDPVRNEAILLLMAIANRNFNIQKLVAFENTFDSLFDIIDEEGGIRGSILVQDCLTLITNLLQYNASNQKFFLETQCIPRLAKLLGEPVEDDADSGMTDENGMPIVAPPMVWTEQRLQNMVIALEICRILVSEDNESLQVNQKKLFQSGVSFIVLKLVFSPVTANAVRSIALLTTADLISSNPDIQLQFSQIDVPYIDPSMPTQLKSYDRPIPVTVALLNWTLFINSVHVFDIRMGAALCLHAYFKENKDSKSAFLTDQIKAYADPEYFSNLGDNKEDKTDDATKDNVVNNGSSNNEVNSVVDEKPQDENTIPTPFGNIFATLMDYDADIKLNPYRLWFASIILIYLFEEYEENKITAQKVYTGDESAGEEVMSSIQAISGLLITTLDNMDPRISIGYLMLLTVWLYEDFNAVNEFLDDSSIIKSILAFLSNNSSELTVLVHGMATILLGVVYEFSSKESPIPRLELHSLLVKAMGRDNYSLKVRQFKDNELFKSFDDESPLSNTKDQTGLPDVYFGTIYVNLIKENFPRLKRALFHDPHAEPQGHISFELYEELDTKHNLLKTQLEEEKVKASETETKLHEEINKLNRDCEDVKLKLDKACNELKELENKHSSVSEKYSNTLKSLQATEKSKKEFETSSGKYFKELQEALKKVGISDDLVKSLEQKLENSEQARQKAEDGINKMSRELFHLSKQKKESDSNIKSHEKKIDSLKLEIANITKTFEARIEKLQKANDLFKEKVEDLNKKISESVSYNEHSDKKSREMKEKLDDVEATNEHLMDKLRSAASAFQEMKSAKASSDNEIDKYKIEIKSKQDEFNSLQLEFTLLKEEKEKINKEFVSFRLESSAEVGKLNSTINDLKLARDSLDSNHSTISNEFEELKEKLSQESKRYSNLKIDYDKQLELLKSENEKLKKDLEDIGNSKANADAKHRSVEHELLNFKAKHTKVKEELEKSLDAKTGEYNDVIEKLKNKDISIASLKETHSKKVSELDSGHSKLSQELEAANSRCLENEKRIKEHLDSSSNQANQILALEKAKGELETSIKNVERETKRSTDEFEKEKAELNQNLTKLEAEKQKAEKRLDLMQTEKAIAEKELTNLKQVLDDNSKLETEVSQLKSEITQFKDEHTSINEKLSSKTKELKEKKDQIENQESKLEDLAKSLDNEKMLVKDLKEKKEALETRIKKLENDITSNSKSSKEMQTKNENLETKLKSTEKDLSSLKSEFANETKILKDQIADHEVSISGLKADLDKKVQEVEKERNMLSENSETVIKEYGDKIKELEKALGIAKTAHESKLNAMSKEKKLADESVKSINIEFEIHKNNTNESTAKLTKEIESLNVKLENEKKLSTSKLSEREEELKKESESLKATEKQLKDEIENLKKEKDVVNNNYQLKNLEFSTLEKDLASKVEEIKSINKVTESYKKESDDGKSKIERLEKDLEAAQKFGDETKEELDSLNQKIEELKSVNSNTEETWTNKLKESEFSYAALDEQKKSISQELSALKSSDKAASEMTKQLENELQTLKDDIEEKSKSKKELEEKSTTLSSTINELENKLDVMRKELDSEKSIIEKLSAELKEHSKLSADLKEYKEKFEELEKEHEQLKKKFDAEGNIHSEKMKELKSKVDSLQDDLTAAIDLKDKIESLNQELVSTKRTKDDEIKKLTKELESTHTLKKNEKELKKDLNSSKANISTLKEDLNVSKENETKLKQELEISKKNEDSLNKELESLKSSQTNKEKDNKDFDSQKAKFLESEKKLKEEVESLKKKLKEQSSSMVPRSELDDLMLLMSDIDEHNKKYKKQLKALGHDISSDEESDEDDDDEDDEDDEDDD